MEALNVGILQLKLPKQSFRSGMKKGENEESGIKHALKTQFISLYPDSDQILLIKIRIQSEKKKKSMYIYILDILFLFEHHED